MTLRLFIAGATLLTLAACGDTSPAARDGAITVVRGDDVRAKVAPQTQQLASAAAATASASQALPEPTPRQLSVTESARIRTDQMWSEPIPAGETLSL